MAVAAIAVTPSLAAAQIPCMLAPATHRVICRYADPGLFKTLIQTASIEAARWAGLKIHEGALERLDASLHRGDLTITEYDSLLREVKRPKVQPEAAFAAVFNTAHPDATIRLTVANGRVMRDFRVGEAADSMLAARRTAEDGDPMRRRAKAVGQLASLLAGGSPVGPIAGQLAEVFAEADSSAARGDSLARRSVGVSARLRKYQDDAGESDATKIAAKARLDRLRSAEALLHTDNLERTITALQRQQAARDAQQRALAAYLKSVRGEW